MLTFEEYKAIKESEKIEVLQKTGDEMYRYGKYYISSWNEPNSDEGNICENDEKNIRRENDEFSVDYLRFKKGYVRMIKNVNDGTRFYDYVPDEIGFFGMKLTDDIIESHIDEIIEYAKEMESELDEE